MTTADTAERETTTTFGEKLKALRKERGWSQDELGRRAGIHGRHVGKYEIGRAMPNAETVVQLAKVLGVSIDYLLRDDLDEDAAPAGALRDQELLRKFAAVEQMDEEDRRVIASLIDAYIKKHQIEEVLHR
jgi:transcriptional regulator with XRE-family HTH domain